MHYPCRISSLVLAGVCIAAAKAAIQANISDVTPQEPTTMAATQPTFTNRLAKATSPYLLQHQHNPVDWYEWGPEAIERARREDKPIFLSIGYAACHWCHVMAHESFEDAGVAAVMNEQFVNIKVDREERPDLDDIYMQATMIANRGQGGWPMSVWLTPDLKPFFAGTYFPPTERWARPGFKQICERLGQAWKMQRAEILASADTLTGMIHTELQPSASDGATLTLAIVDQCAETLARVFDEVHGGMSGGGTNKFPPSMGMDVMLRSAARRAGGDAGRERLLRLVDVTLDEMSRGGIYDHLSGGIARYSTDVEWLVPHFEKMLYDQALVSRIYLDACQFNAGDAAKRGRYADVVRSVFDYVLSDLQHPEGGFYSSRDADSEGEEGKFYVWQKPEVVAAIGGDDAELFCGFYDVTDRGNWEDPHAPGVPKNILRIKQPFDAFVAARKLDREQTRRRLDAAREKLLAVRARRVAPGLDDKILCEWNGLMISSLARGGAVLGEAKYIVAAARAADAVLLRQFRGGKLARSFRAGRTLDAAFLSDYAAMIDGLIELYEATGDSRWIASAVELNAVLTRDYWDSAAGGYYFTAHTHETLITRNKDLRDSAIPSGNSVQVLNLLRLSVMLGDEQLREMAERTMRCFAKDVADSPWSSERFLSAVEFAHVGPVELAVVGDAADARTQALVRVIHETYLPNRVVVYGGAASGGSAGAGAAAALAKSPLLENRGLVDGKPAVYVCRNYACLKPATSAEELREQLAR